MRIALDSDPAHNSVPARHFPQQAPAIPIISRRSAMTAGPSPVTPLSPDATSLPASIEHGTQNARRAAVASFIGSTLEYYDFFIYGSASALIFNKIFFPGIDPALGMVLSMATIGIGYVVRPLAAG